jgi:hypothetical protein
MEFSMIHSFEYLNQPIDVIITQLSSGHPYAGNFVIKVLVKKTGREVSPRRANDVTYFSDLIAAKAAGETLGRRLVDAARTSHLGLQFRDSKKTSAL